MPEEKIKITKKELEDIYHIIDDHVDGEEIKIAKLVKKDANSEFELYTEDYDKEEDKMIEDAE